MARQPVTSTQLALRSTGPDKGDDGGEVLAKGHLVDHYVIMRLLSRGGMGEVYVARDSRLGRKVALKLIHPKYLGSPEAKARFVKEARTTARFNHPHIVTIHGVGEHEGRPYVALEYLEGQNLRERMLERRPTLQATLRIALAVADALAEAHASSVLHLDLKPENVVIPRDGRVRVVDFGLARPEGLPPAYDAPPDAGPGKPSGVWGTPAYMAPEQWKGAHCTAATDVWALGMMLFELCSDWLPYDLEGSKSKLMEAVCGDEQVPKVDRYADVPRELSELIAQCLQKDAKRRPSALEVSESLRELLFGEATRPADEEGPFRGLLPFTERHVDLFFGREAEVAAFVERVRVQPVLPVVGPSGVGKSSFVQAGVMPRLRELDAISFIKMRPGTRPFDTLASRLLRIEQATITIRNSVTGGLASVAPGSVPSGPLSSGGGVASDPGYDTASDPAAGPPDSFEGVPSIPPPPRAPRLHDGVSGPRTVPPSAPPLSDPPTSMERSDAIRLADELKESPHRLAIALRRLATLQGTRVLLFVDQLEELFTLVEDDAERRAFMKAICTAADDAADPIRVVFTVRDDFLGRLATGPEVTRALEQVTVIQTLDHDALEEVLVRPVRAVGYRFQDPDLPREMIESLGEASSSLPLLQFAARLLWERRDKVRRLLLRSAYEDMGGVEGALAQHADGVLDALDHDELLVARELLLRMVTPERTRRRILRKEALDGLGEVGSRVLSRLTGARLVALTKRGRSAGGGVMLELAHESLIRTWGTLAGWLDDSRDELSFLEEAGQAAELWDKRGRPVHEVWAGEALADATRKLARCTTEVPAKVRDFLEAGREREQSRQRRKRLFIASAIGFSALVATVAVVVALFVADKEQEAQRQRAATLVEAARIDLSRDSMLEARAKLRLALEVADDPAARALWWQLSASPQIWKKELGERMYAVAFSPDGKVLAAGGHDESVYLFDLATREQRILHGNADQIFSITFANDSRWLATASYDGRVRLWDLRSGSQSRVLNTKDSLVRSVAYSPDGEQLAGAGHNGEVYVWNVRSGERERVLKGHGAAVRDVAFDPGGKWLASSDAQGGLFVWDLKGDGFEQLEGHQGAVMALAFGPDGRLVSAGEDKLIRVWDVASGTLVRELAGHRETINELAVSADGSLAASASDDSSVRLWDLNRFEPLAVFHGHDKEIGSVALSPDGTRVASAGRDHTVRLWDAHAAGELQRGDGEMTGARSVAFSPGGALLATSHYDGRVRVWDASTGELKKTLRGETTSAFWDVAFSPDGALLASSGDDWAVRLWDVASGLPKTVLAGHSGAVVAVAFHPSGKQLASASADRTVRVWDLESATSLAVIRADEDRLIDVAYAPDGSWLVTTGGEGRARIWNSETLELERELGRPGLAPAQGVAVRGDGKAVATSHTDGTVWVWDVESGKGELVGRHPERVYWLTFHPNGDWIGAPGSDGSARIWHISSKRSVELVGHLDEVNNVEFSADGRLAATVADDGTLRLWDAKTGRPHWRAPALLSAPPRLYSHAGWQRLDGQALDRSRARTAWEKAIEQRARWVSHAPSGNLLCIQTFDGVVELWDMSSDERVLKEQVQGLEQVLALDDGYLARGEDGAWLYRRSVDSKQRLLETKVSAMAIGGREILLATGNEVHRFGLDGQRIGRVAATGTVSAMALAGDSLAVGYRDGNLELLPLEAGARSASDVTPVVFQGVPSSAPRRMLAGPMDTLIVGYNSGFVGIWNRRDGTLLVGTRLHGQIAHLLLEGRQLYAATDLGRSIRWDLSAFHVDYCTLLRQVWAQVPVVWDAGRPTLRPPPLEHACR